MYKLIQFLKRYYVLFIFIVLEAMAINYYASSTSYSRAKLISASNNIMGAVHSVFAWVGDYFTLSRDNKLLIERLAAAENELAVYKAAEVVVPDHEASQYYYTTAKIISNSIARQDNFIIINKGTRHGIQEDMTILSVDGSVVGYVQKCSDNYSVCVSILNSKFSVGGKLKGKEYFGSVVWDGVSPRSVTLKDIPRYAPVQVGDTVQTIHSDRFPPDSFIGVVTSFEEAEDGVDYDVKVRPGVSMTSLSDVMVIYYKGTQELNELGGEYFIDRPRPGSR